MLEGLWIVVSGMIAGVAHVASGPDHFAAVAPLALARKRAWPAGLAWGAGHAAGAAVIAFLARFVIVPLLVDPSVVSRYAELVVGVSLVFVGVRSLRAPEKAAATTATAFGIGTLHGLAGSSHLAIAVPATALEVVGAIAYLAAYAVGGLAAMAMFTWLIGLQRLEALRNRLGRIAAWIAVAVGVVWLAMAAIDLAYPNS